MMQLSADKEARAWYVLAELIARGRKEHALGVYRLLAHTLHDEVVAHHLLADILYTFGDYDGAGKMYERVVQRELN
jgi:tetratricopeptide (TPR) repeat protein